MNYHNEFDDDRQLIQFNKAVNICEEILVSGSISLMFKENKINDIKKQYNYPNNDIVVFKERYNHNILLKCIGDNVKFIISPKIIDEKNVLVIMSNS